MGNICFGDKKVENDPSQDNPMNQTRKVDSNVDPLQNGTGRIMPINHAKCQNPFRDHPAKKIESVAIDQTNHTGMRV